MKTIKLNVFAILLGLLMVSSGVKAQDEKSYVITATKLHWNMALTNFSMEDWKAVEKEYFDKVVSKNPYILGQDVLMHFFTNDNTEIILVHAFDSWGSIELSAAKDLELEKAAWPNEKDRTAFMDKRKQYYANSHSDEIYSTMAYAKMPKANFDKDILYYVRISHFAYPKDGTDKEFSDLRKQYFDAVTNKNEFIKAYYPHRHAWGADSTQFTEVFAVESLADLDKALTKNTDLFKAAWPDEKKRTEQSNKMKKYLTGVHEDYIYSSVHELSK